MQFVAITIILKNTDECCPTLNLPQFFKQATYDKGKI